MMLTADQFAQLVIPEFQADGRRRKNMETRRAKRSDRRMRLPIAVQGADGGWRMEYLRTRDCSSRGMCVLRDAPLKPGAQMVTIFPKAEGGTTRILTTVVHCRAAAKGIYAIGAEFTCLLDRKATAANVIDPAELQRISQAVLDGASK